MASYLQILESAYSLAKNKYKNNSFTIDSLIGEMQDKNILDKNEHNVFGLFYNEILKDTRFIYCGNKKGCLREFLTLAQIKTYKNSLFDITKVIADDIGNTTPDISAKAILDDEEPVVEESEEESEEKLDTEE